MRILIIGGDGMLGHQLRRNWSARHEVWCTLRQDRGAYPNEIPAERAIHGVDVRRLADVLGAIGQCRPEAIVNAAGIVKQREAAKEIIPSLEVNALFPHLLARACAAAGVRLVHISTDCVFSGSKGRYVEADPPDPVDVYGWCKLLGEVTDAPGCLTLRTSVIGLDRGRGTGLVEWFLAQRGRIRGHRGAIYTGLTSAEMARAIEHLLVHDPGLEGLWHLSSAPISKFDLLAALARRLAPRDVEIVPDDELRCDRSLDSSAIRARTRYRVPAWDDMLDALAAEIRWRERGT